MNQLSAIPVRGIGEVKPGDVVAELILGGLACSGLRLEPGDILVVTHKIVSKAEGRIVPLATVVPRQKAQRWARAHRLDARVVELALREAVRVVRMRKGVLITETRHGFVCANSGVDVSNMDGGRSAVLLPENPDRSARQLHRTLKARIGVAVPVIISDTFGRPWREGLTEVALGLAGMKAFRDFRSCHDPFGYRLRVTLEAVADELAAMAGLAC